eukprot:CAMPEP_0177579508 /NCGR_PEP_ID=MMETSP0419_2-20121207/1003_1 /TAXON_ID=582737 /ORGANISM="Tetraselmis sp., Strain GSL018" /LENGTH=543 /DNA_ID=CAMNT_0019068191 /DNA_START=854 /DNA_END=2486 /DNA_ORIENTATION=-
MYVPGLSVLLSLEMWSSAFVSAVKSSQETWLNRCLWSHWYGAPSALLLLFSFTLSVRAKFFVARHWELATFTYLVLFNIVIQSFIMLYNLAAEKYFLRVIRSFPKMCFGKSRSSVVLPAAIPSVEGVEALTGGFLSPRTGLSHTKSTKFRNSAGFRRQKMNLLVPLSLLLVATALGSSVTLGAIWFVRVIFILLIILVSEEPSGFGDLEASDPAFGLVVSAAHIRRALRCYLEGQKYKGLMPRYKASYFRMQDTLTVSYRWQQKEVCLAPSAHINMSRWQLEELLAAIGSSRCLYVWIDKLSVPQRSCELQSTLLARMMSVYATSKETLVLRSSEPPGSRYHQRAWTLQEYCCARRIRVVTQPVLAHGGEDGTGGPLASVAGDEETVFPETRLWHLRRAAACRPYWLGGFRTPAEASEMREVLSRLGRLSSRVVCQEAADRVRALYPMMLNTPCEDQRELVDLVRRTARAAEAAPPDWEACASLVGGDLQVIESMPDPPQSSQGLRRDASHSLATRTEVDAAEKAEAAQADAAATPPLPPGGE